MAEDSVSPQPQDDTFGDNSWKCSHEKFVAEGNDKEPDVLFFGDSLFAWLRETEIYKEQLAPMHSLCFGLLGDTTANLLWRVEQGELNAIRPKVIFISAGGDNRGKAESVVRGIVKVAEAVAAKQPQAQLFVLKLLPRGQTHNPRRELVAGVNEGLEAALNTALPAAKLLDIDPGFIAADGTIDCHDMWDYVHLSQEGYRKAFDTVALALTSLLQPDL